MNSDGDDADTEGASRAVGVANLELKTACQGTYERLLASGLTSADIARETGLRDSTIRKLKADGISSGWRPPSLQTCHLLDPYIEARFGQRSPLAELRANLAAARADQRAAEQRQEAIRQQLASRGAHAVDEAMFLECLKTLVGGWNELSGWHPFGFLTDGFQRRLVAVSEDPPQMADGSHSLYDDVRPLPRGDVRWNQAVAEIGVVVVLADAGFGKTWQLREHAIRLATTLAEEIQRRSVSSAKTALPLLLHAEALARAWQAAAEPADAFIDAAAEMVGPAHARTLADMHDELRSRLSRDDAGPIAVLVDAYDEVISQRDRDAVKVALRWLDRQVRPGGVSIIMTSRRAGYEDPFGSSREPHSDPIHYTRLGVLDEAQVRQIWRQWFDRLGQPLPADRLNAVLSPESALRQVAHVPLIATFCAWVAENDTVAQSRTGLFKQVVDRFLARVWNSTGPRSYAIDDVAARATLTARLAKLAWFMATRYESWSDAIAPAEAEALIDAVSPAGHPSLVWRLLHESGVLVQPGASRDAATGSAPIMWIHRSIHEYLTAIAILDAEELVVDSLVTRDAWPDPIWANVLQHAISLEGGDGGSITASVRAQSIGGHDGLGWYSTLLAAGLASRGGRIPLDRQLRERFERLHATGIIASREYLIYVARADDVDHESLVQLIASRSIDADNFERWEALTWCNQAGRAELQRLIATDPDANGAAAVLRRRDQTAASRALAARVRAGFDITAADAEVLADLDPASVKLLIQRYRADPASSVAAKTVGHTGAEQARRVLAQRQLLGSELPTIRSAAIQGLVCWYGNNVDQRFIRLLLQYATSDHDSQVRVLARSRLSLVGLSVPWVARLLDQQFIAVHHEAALPAPRTLDDIATMLQSGRVDRELAITMVREQPRLLSGPVVLAMEEITAVAMQGGLSATENRDVLLIGGSGTIEAASARLVTVSAPAQLQNLATGLCFARPDNPAVFDTLATYAGRNPGVLTEALLRMHDTPRTYRIECLIRQIGGSTSRAATQTWAAVLARLLVELAPQDRHQWREAIDRLG